MTLCESYPSCGGILSFFFFKFEKMELNKKNFIWHVHHEEIKAVVNPYGPHKNKFILVWIIHLINCACLHVQTYTTGISFFTYILLHYIWVMHNLFKCNNANNTKHNVMLISKDALALYVCIPLLSIFWISQFTFSNEGCKFTAISVFCHIKKKKKEKNLYITWCNKLFSSLSDSAI